MLMKNVHLEKYLLKYKDLTQEELSVIFSSNELLLE